MSGGNAKHSGSAAAYWSHPHESKIQNLIRHDLLRPCDEYGDGAFA